MAPNGRLPERSRFDDDQIAYNGNEEFEQPPEQEFEEFEQQREQQSNHNLDNEGNEFRDSFSHRDSAAGKLFVGGVSWETTEENFSNYFSKYGEIVDSVIMIDKHTGKPRGFGFVTFSDPMVIDSVLEVEHVIDGRVVEVKRTVPREDIGFKGASKRKKIFVGGIPTSLTDDELGEYFSAYGTIVEHQIMLDHKTGRSRGFGFVTFENEDALDKIFSDGKVHELGGKQVEIKKAEPKRGGGDFSGSSARSYGSLSGAAAGYGAYNSGSRHNGKMGRGYGGGGYGPYGAYNNYGGNYAGGYAGFYGGYGGNYGGYGYGFGYGGPMYGNAGYPASGYGMPAGYGGNTAYAGSKGYGSGAAGRGGRGGSRGGGSYGSSGGYDRSDGNDRSGGSSTGRYHPYQK
ncbi:heterogeneous nuclear ribonucleoprotein A0 [Pyrus x bretschneideri]|uniref:heterogeneous nuclear ribonucleoprotein A0 n=1 Tax=Pyrus x bretschneideri TaxID=225117 RepID=UPI00202FF296|nr:heterogeneous nuclear ribonucleoprotein A0 [Pyrus x bretschneideri]